MGKAVVSSGAELEKLVSKGRVVRVKSLPRRIVLERYSPRRSLSQVRASPRKRLLPALSPLTRRSPSSRRSLPGQWPPGTEAGGRERAKGTVQAGAEAGLRDRGPEETGQGRQPGQGGAESRHKTPFSDRESADGCRTEQQQNREQPAAGEGKGAAPAGGARKAKYGAVEDSTSEGREQDVPHGGDNELHAPAPGRVGRDPKDGQRSV